MVRAAEPPFEVTRGVHADVATADDEDPGTHAAMVRTTESLERLDDLLAKMVATS